MLALFERKDRWGNPLSIWLVASMAFVAPLVVWSLSQIDLRNDVGNWLPANDPQRRALSWSHEQFPDEETILITWDSSTLADPRVAQFAQAINDRNRPHPAQHFFRHVTSANDVLQTLQRQQIAPEEAARRLSGLLIGTGPVRIKLSDAARSHLRRARQRLIEQAQTEIGQSLKLYDASQGLALDTRIPLPVETVEAAGEATDANADAEGAVDTEGASAAGADSSSEQEFAPPVALSAGGEVLELASLDYDLSIAWNGSSSPRMDAAAFVDWLSKCTFAASPTGPAVPIVEQSFFILGAPVGLVATLSEAGAADASESVRTLRKLAQSLGIPSEELHLGGSPVASQALNQEVKRAAWNSHASWKSPQRRSILLTSVLVGAGLAYLLVRQWRAASLALFVSLWTTLITLAIVPPTGGSMNMVLVVLPTLLLVCTLSGAIHVANYWQHAIALDPAHVITRTVRDAALPCLLASVTTAIGLASLMTSPLAPVRDFGLYGAIGMGVSFCMVAYGLPALLQIWPAPGRAITPEDTSPWRAFGQFIAKSPLPHLALWLVATVVLGAGLMFFATETKIIRYFRDSARVVGDYETIESELCGIVPLNVIVKFDETAQKQSNLLVRMELVRSLAERLRLHPEVTGCLSLADFQPVAEIPPVGASMLANGRFARRANTIEQRLRGGEYPEASGYYTVAQSDADWFKTGDRGLCHAGDELWQISAQVSLMTRTTNEQILAQINQLATETLRSHAGVTHVTTGTVPVFLQTQRAVLNSLIQSSLLAVGLILVVFLLLLRNLPAALLAMIPNIVPVLMVFGGMSWLGYKVDIGIMITASIAMGIAVDGTLHYLTWLRRGLQRGCTRREAVVAALGHCGPAMLQTSLVVAIGLAVLIPAELLLISRFGLLLSSMTLVALLADLLLLPAIVLSPLGACFEVRPTVAADGGIDDGPYPAGQSGDAARGAASPETAAPDSGSHPSLALPLMPASSSQLLADIEDEQSSRGSHGRVRPPAPHLRSIGATDPALRDT